MSTLELGIPAEAALRLRRHPLVAALTQGRPRRARERALYFDTADLVLARAGIALCVRRVGRASVQSVARIDAQHVRAAATADTVMSTDAPDLARIPDEALRADVVRAVAGRPLAPMWEVELARETRLLREDANEVLLALDTGTLRAAGAETPLGTLAFEVQHGDPAYPAQLALELLDALPFRLAARHPAARARELLLGESAAPRKAEPVVVAPEVVLEELIVAVIESCLAQIAGNEEAALLDRDPEGVHQIRVGVRRLRAALSFFRPVLPERSRVAMRDALGALARELGPARDLDAFAAEWLAPALAARPDDEDLARFDAELRRARATEGERVRALLRSDRFPRLVLEIRRWVARRAWREQPLSAASATLFLPAREAVSRRIERRHRKLRRALRRIEEATPEERHRVRIEAKKLRYAAEASACLFPGRRARRYARRLAALQDALGLANDAVVAERIAREFATRIGGGAGTERAAGFLAGWAAQAAQREIERLPQLADRFEAASRFWPRPPAEHATTP